MDDRLLERLNKINTQIDELKIIEKQFLHLSAHEKILYARLFLRTKGHGNNEDRKSEVMASQDWIDFAEGLVEAEANYQEARRRYELKLKAYDAEHLTFKNENPAIKRQL